MNDLDKLFQTAWATKTPTSLDRLAEKLAKEGVHEQLLMDACEKLLFDLRENGISEAQEEIVLAVMDRLSGWCHPANRIHSSRDENPDKEYTSTTPTMTTELLEVFATDSNYAIIKPPGRRFPGCVIQGDSLGSLCRLATGVAKRIRDKEPTDEEFLGDVQDLVADLVSRILHYQRILQVHGIELPYSTPFTEHDIIKLLPESTENY